MKFLFGINSIWLVCGDSPWESPGFFVGCLFLPQKFVLDVAEIMAYFERLCWDCVINHPYNRNLECKSPHIHHRNIDVVWNEALGHFECWNNSMPEVRNVIPPKIFKGPFLLCHHYSNCPRGDSCTFAHSISELLYWNIYITSLHSSLVEVSPSPKHKRRPNRKRSHHDQNDLVSCN